MRREHSAKAVDKNQFYDIIKSFNSHKNVFVHIGLSQVKEAFSCNPYDFLMECFSKNFKSVIAPGFTPSFKTTGLFHKKFSRPEYGLFSKLLLNDATYRTDDPVYSLLVYGDFEFEKMYNKEVFGEGGTFSQLDKENVLCLNIGTIWPVSSNIHFTEYKNELPYIKKAEYKGIIYYDDVKHEKTSSVVYQYDYWFNKYVTLLWNRFKLLKQMRKKGIIDVYNLNGLNIYAFRLKDLRLHIEDNLRKNPYYLIT